MSDQLLLLQNYTHFHIGIYLTMGTAIVGALAYDRVHFSRFPIVPKGVLIVSVLSFFVAGMCGGIVAAKIPEVESFAALSDARLGIRIPPMTEDAFAQPARIWMSLEHAAFWVGVLLAMLGGVWIVLGRRAAVQPGP